MQAIDLIELAAVVSASGQMLIDAPTPVCLHMVQRYWVASKCRFDRWGRNLQHELPSRKLASAARISPTWQAFVQEILISEPLARLWAAVLVAHDRQRGKDEASLLVRAISQTHAELRFRVLTRLLQNPHIPTREAVEINRLRRRAEQWSDWLLAPMQAAGHDLLEFANRPERVLDLAAEMQRRRGHRPTVQGITALTAAARVAFRSAVPSRSANDDVNQRIAAAVVGAIQTEQFDTTGVPSSLVSARLWYGVTDTQVCLEELFAEEAAENPRRDDLNAPSVFVRRGPMPF